MKEYAKRVQPIALYGAGCWIWCKQLFGILYRWENAMLRRIMNVKRKTDEPFAKFIRRSTTDARAFFHKQGFDSLPTLALKAMHREAGKACQALHCFRASHGHVSQPKISTCFPGACMYWRDNCWWEFLQTVGQEHDPSNISFDWRHSKSGRRLQWED
eukprot:2341521-Karenia_brevis.AAC.1